MEGIRIILLHVLAYVRVIHQYIAIWGALSTWLQHLLTGKIIFVTVFSRSEYAEVQSFIDCTLMLCSDGLMIFISIANRRTDSRSCNCSLLVSYSSVSQPPGRGPVPGPGINYTGPREFFLELVILVS